MKQHRSAQGKIVDMTALATKHERTRAVGNIPVNARGDTIDGNGKIVVPVTQKVGEKYQKSVGNKSANPVKQPTPVKATPTVQAPKQELTKEELELDSSLDGDLEIEQIKAQENKK